MKEFILYPAIDLRDGRCVRLTKGDYDAMTVYREDPVQVAQEFAAAGAAFVHVVDLDAAREGDPTQQGTSNNRAVIERVANSAGVPIQVGGGIRSLERIEELFQAGVTRCILGSAAVRDPAFVDEALRVYGERIVIGIDARDGYVAVHGWTETSEIQAVELGKRLHAMGATRTIFTDIARDGMLSGPNTEAILNMAEETELSVIASGGVSGIEDIARLAQYESRGIGGVIVGKAIYAGRVDVSEALARIAAIRETRV